MRNCIHKILLLWATFLLLAFLFFSSLLPFNTHYGYKFLFIRFYYVSQRGIQEYECIYQGDENKRVRKI